jgi:putative flippase GtrA
MTSMLPVRQVLRRYASYSAVGAMGTAVHLGALSALARAAGLHPAVASLLAVELALLHNFCWHERWTWADRGPGHRRSERLLRFHGANGLVSLAGNAMLVPVFVQAGLPVEGAGIAAIMACSVVNFLLADRVVFTGTAAIVALAAGAVPAAAGPSAEALDGWRAYIQAVEARRSAERAPMASTPAASLRALQAGRIEVEELAARGDNGQPIEVDSASVHHWRGRMFVAGVDLETLLARVRDPALHRAQPDVLDARVLRQDADSLDLFLRITRSQIVTATFDTEHHVRYARLGPARATATSVSTRITELGRGGGDRGFLWRLNAYWRYEAIDGGVLIECESVSLSRTVPALLRPVAGPIVRSFARESMSRTLTALGAALRRTS